MFSLATPSMSERPLPPHPMQAMCSLSDGARYPRPSTYRGTMVNAAPAATSPTNFLLVIRFRSIRLLLTSLTLRFFFTPSNSSLTLRFFLMPSNSSAGTSCLRIRRPEHHREEHQHHRREGGGKYPEAAPLLQRELRRAPEEPVEHPSGHLGADEHPEAIRHQDQESLGLPPDRRCGSFVDVDLAGHEEEIVTHAVQQNADDDEADDRIGGGKGEERVAQHPRRHAHHQHPLHPETQEHQRHEQHESGLGNLPPRLDRGDLRGRGVAEEGLGEVVVPPQGDAQAERRDDEYVERAIAELRQCVDSDDA